MKTTRIKNLLIVVFLLADLALGIILYTDYVSSTQPSNEEIDAVVTLLQNRGVTLNPMLLSQRTRRLPTLTLQISSVADKNGDFSFSEPYAGALTEEFALSYMKDKNICTDYMQLAEKKENSLTFREAYHDIPLIHSYITFATKDNTLSVSGKLYIPEATENKSTVRVHHALSALSKLCREPNLPKKATITSISLGYAEYLSSEDSTYSEGSGIAVWKITLNNGNTYIFEATN